MEENTTNDINSPTAVTVASQPLPEPEAPPAPLPTRTEPEVEPQGCAGGCANTTGDPGIHYLYTIGSMRAAFPSKSIEKEFNQITGRMGNESPDEELIYDVFSQGANLYLAREMCWIMQIDGIDAYIVKPRTYVELNEIIESLQPQPGKQSLSVVVGPRGPLAGPEVCNGLQLPLAVCNQYYHFTFDAMVANIAQATRVGSNVAASMLTQMLQLADNAGDTDEHRAVNYIALRYMGVYTMAASMLQKTTAPYGVFSLTNLSARPAAVQGARNIVDVIFTYEERDSGEIIHWFTRVDVTGQFPFLVSKLSRYFPGP